MPWRPWPTPLMLATGNVFERSPALVLCYVSITMSTWLLSPTIIIIITPIWDATVVYHIINPSDYSDISLSQSPSYSEVTTTPSTLSLLQVHYHWHILCQHYLVIISRYHLSLFTQHFNFWLCVSGVQACTEWSFTFITCLFHVSDFTCSL